MTWTNPNPNGGRKPPTYKEDIMSDEESDLRRLEDFEKKVRRITHEYMTPDAQEKMDRELRRLEIKIKIDAEIGRQKEERLMRMMEVYDREVNDD